MTSARTDSPVSAPETVATPGVRPGPSATTVSRVSSAIPLVVNAPRAQRRCAEETTSTIATTSVPRAPAAARAVSTICRGVTGRPSRC
ncbi:hypothetical protein [Phytohabitans suffuscus]|uniref:hypothetical protein n=1 Tax=Phytohabitans suffuscus TaxID=624315 RepID=UPI001E2DF0F8|nr:hypothetical protein [Phytohabitans suffuscus]